MQRAADENVDEHITLTQSNLIDHIINAFGLDTNSNGLNNPAPKKPFLPKNSEGSYYASVVGTAMYLCKNSQPDIAFAVHQSYA